MLQDGLAAGLHHPHRLHDVDALLRVELARARVGHGGRARRQRHDRQGRPRHLLFGRRRDGAAGGGALRRARRGHRLVERGPLHEHLVQLARAAGHDALRHGPGDGGHDGRLQAGRDAQEARGAPRPRHRGPAAAQLGEAPLAAAHVQAQAGPRSSAATAAPSRTSSCRPTRRSASSTRTAPSRPRCSSSSTLATPSPRASYGRASSSWGCSPGWAAASCSSSWRCRSSPRAATSTTPCCRPPWPR